MKADSYPMQGVHCGARTRQGKPCRNLPMKNGRCRLHGGKSKTGREHGRYTHGQFTKEAIVTRRQLVELLREARQFIREV